MSDYKYAKTIMLTTSCSAKCFHCPFSKLEVPQKHLDIDKVKSIIKNSNDELLIFSGGEPFEYRFLNELYSVVATIDDVKKFRIATGGHVDLKNSLNQLKALSAFDGISLGTDVIMDENVNLNFKQTWINNLNYFKEIDIPFSLTFTLTSLTLDLKKIETAFKTVSSLELQPEFIYIRFMDYSNNQIDEIKFVINELYPNMKYILDDINLKSVG